MSRILVVEDNPVNMRLACELLLHAGHEVDTAMTVEEACSRLAAAARPALVLLDLQIPGGGGGRVLQYVRADPRLAGLRVVALTAQAMQGDRERILGEGYDDYIAKPIQARSFAAQIDSLLAGGQA